MRAMLEEFLKAAEGLQPKSRALLLAFKAATSDGRKSTREAVKEALRRHTGEDRSDDAFAKVVSRLNRELDRLDAPFTLAARQGELRLVGTASDLEVQVTSRSDQATRAGSEARLPPRATRDRLQVFFTHAWLEDRKQQEIQIKFCAAVQQALKAPHPPKFEHLPTIEVWRDIDRWQHSAMREADLLAECDRSFLALVSMSRAYPGKPYCQKEFDRFVDQEGKDHNGKQALIVSFDLPSCKDVPLRYWSELRIWVTEEHENLLNWANRKPAGKDDLVQRTVHQIRLAAMRHLGMDPPQQPPTNSPLDAANLDLEQRSDWQSKGHASTKVVPGRAQAARTGEAALIVDHLLKWASSRHAPRLTALLGDFGMGKTVTCQVLTQSLLEARKQNPQIPLPIYVDLRLIKRPAAIVEQGLAALLREALALPDKQDIDSHQLISFARDHSALFIFDGIDEVTTKLTMDEARRLYAQILSIVPKECWEDDRKARTKKDSEEANTARRGRPSKAIVPISLTGPLVLLSCRTHYFAKLTEQDSFLLGQDRASLSERDIAVWYMLPFTNAQIEAYVRQNLTADEARKALAAINGVYDLKGLAPTPIFLKLISEVTGRLEERKRRGERVDISILYEIFIDRIFERDAGKHLLGTGETKKFILSELALHLHRRDRARIQVSELEKWLFRLIQERSELALLRAALSGESAITMMEKFCHDLRNATLLVRPSDSDFGFGHTSIREYFLAEAIYRNVSEQTLGEGVIHGVTVETLDFIRARFEGLEESDRVPFAIQIAQLLGKGGKVHDRALAYMIIMHFNGLIEWPNRADLSNLDVHNTRFSKDNLPPGAIWHKANISDNRYDGCSFQGHDFSESNAQGSVFTNCDIGNAEFRNANVHRALFRDCYNFGEFQPLSKGAIVVDRSGGAARHLSGALRNRTISVQNVTVDYFNIAAGQYNRMIAVSIRDTELCGWCLNTGKRVLSEGLEIGSVSVLFENSSIWAEGRVISPLNSIFKSNLVTTNYIVCRSSGRNVIISRSDHNTIALSDCETGSCFKTQRLRIGRIVSLYVTRDGRQLVACSATTAAIMFVDDLVKWGAIPMRLIGLSTEHDECVVDLGDDAAGEGYRASYVSPNAWRMFSCETKGRDGTRLLWPVEALLDMP